MCLDQCFPVLRALPMETCCGRSKGAESMTGTAMACKVVKFQRSGNPCYSKAGGVRSCPDICHMSSHMAHVMGTKESFNVAVAKDAHHEARQLGTAVVLIGL